MKSIKMYRLSTISSRINGLPHVNIYSVAMYIFFLAILLQNTVSLSNVSLGLGISITAIYIVKDLLLVLLVCLILTTKTNYKFSNIDQVALLLAVFLIVKILIRGGGFYDIAMQMRFYLTPMILYFVGRNIVPFYQGRDIVRFVLIIGSVYAFLGLMFVLIDRDYLLQIGLGNLLSEKLGHFGREDAVVEGFPINFYFNHADGGLTNRAFGALFDPLASAFFGAVLFFHLLESCRRTVSIVAKILAVAIGVLILLSITRAIIFGIILALLLFQFRKKEIRLVPATLIFFVLIILGAQKYGNIETFAGSLDPSTISHLYAYTKLDINSLMLGDAYESGQARGAESIYLTILKEHGLGLLLLYLLWVFILYRWLRENYQFPFAYATSASLLVYALASLTTEHWFVLSSGAIFWFLLGNNVTAIQITKRNIMRKTSLLYLK